MEQKATGTLNPISIGGMVTKLQAARKAALFGVPTVLANGKAEGLLERILLGEEVGTLFTFRSGNKLTSRKHWIAFTLEPAGKVIRVDEGAKKAILQKGKSLLPSGVLSERRASSAWETRWSSPMPAGSDFARGLTNYDSAEINRIKGH
jgi:glutamate 5-kinase